MTTELMDLPHAAERLAGPADVRRRARRSPTAALRPRLGLGPVGHHCHDLMAASDELGLRRAIDQLLAEGITVTTILQEFLLPALDELTADRRSTAEAVLVRVLEDHRPAAGPELRHAIVVGDHDDPLSSITVAAALRDDGWTVATSSPSGPPTLGDDARPDLVVIDGHRGSAISEAATREGVPVVRTDPDETLYAVQFAARVA